MKFFTLILYVACFVIANPVRIIAAPVIEIYDEPRLALTQSYLDNEGKRRLLGPSDSRLRIVNFWALWCADCVAELASLDRLDAIFDDREVDVITIATGKNESEDVQKLFNELRVQNLTQYYDPKSRLAHQAGAVSIPYSIILDHTGAEVGRLIGAAQWDNPDMVKQIISINSK